jgi:hypothetical protein
MLLREVPRHRPRPLLFAACVGAFSVVAALAMTAAFLSLVACRRPQPATLSNTSHCIAQPRPAIHCPGLQVLVYRDCQWGCE